MSIVAAAASTGSVLRGRQDFLPGGKGSRRVIQVKCCQYKHFPKQLNAAIVPFHYLFCSKQPFVKATKVIIKLFSEEGKLLNQKKLNNI